MRVRVRSGALRYVLPLLWLLLAVTVSPVLAHQTNTGSRGDQDSENRLLMPTYEREELRRGRRETRPESRPAQAQIIEDFRRLQLLNNQVQEGSVRQGSAEKRLIKSLGEIRKRATRLKANLALTALGSEKGSSEPRADADLESLLGRLDQSIQSFVRNPMFRSTRVVDVGLARRASVDLERVIELSQVIADCIRKGAR